MARQVRSSWRDGGRRLCSYLHEKRVGGRGSYGWM